MAGQPKGPANSNKTEATRCTVAVSSEAIVLSKRDQEAIAQAMQQPASPGPRLVAAYKKYKDRIVK